MRAKLEAIVDELKRLKAGGVSSVYIEPSSLAQLKAAAQDLSGADSIPGGNPSLAVSEPKPKQAAGGDIGMSSKAREMMETPLIDLASYGKTASKPKASSAGGSGGSKKYVTAPIPEPPVVELPEGDKQTQWAWLQKRVLECPVCNEHVKKDRGKKVVFGVGSLEADIFFCGEAPGAEEEIQGEPFVGPAGQLLTKIIKAMGLSREKVYIGNIMNWRPELPTSYGNRKPYPEEMAFCLPYLKAQLAIVRPKVVVAMGATAVDGLIGPDPNRRMMRIRGKWDSFENTPMMVTFHPSYLLRNNTLQTKRMVWEDMLQVMEKLDIPISEKQRGFFLK